MLLDIGLFKKQNKTKQKTKTKPSSPPQKKEIKIVLSLGYPSFLFLQQKM